jgi:flagellar operon protein (TIGR03826 family)
MDVRNCKNCGRLFNYLNGPNICPACRDDLEKKFIEVKEYVRNNSGASIQQVADDNEVSVQQIRQWIREERLEFSKDSPVGIECESCGATIRTGRYCEACKGKLQKNLDSLVPKKDPRDDIRAKRKERENKMRFLQS